MTSGARRGIEHKVTADATMYPGLGPSGVELIPLRPACLCIYQWSLGYNGAPRAARREEEEGPV